MLKRKESFFSSFTTVVSTVLGHAWVFMAALIALVLWGLSGPFMGFSNTWQLIINTSTTIITFLMVFIIQNTQNRDNMAMNIKLDAILRELGIDRDDLVRAEDKSDKDLERQKRQFQERKAQAKKQGRR